jgi:hypothetical protein
MTLSISKPEHVEILLRGKNGCSVMNMCIEFAEQDFALAHRIMNAGAGYWDKYFKAQELKLGKSSLTLDMIVKAADKIVARNTPFYKTDRCIFCCSLTLGGETGYYAAF